MSDPRPPLSDPLLQAESEIPVYFVREHLQHIYTLIYQLVEDVELAQELTQETFIRALQRSTRPRQLTRVAKQLPVLAAAVCLEHLRSDELHQLTQKPKKIRQKDQWPQQPHTDALHVLTISERVALLLHDTEHIALSTIARRLDCPAATARIHLARARVKVAQYFRSKKAAGA